MPLAITALVACSGFTVPTHGPSEARPPAMVSQEQDEWSCTTIIPGGTDHFPIGATVLSPRRSDTVFVVADMLDKRTQKAEDLALLAAYQCAGSTCEHAERIVGPLELGGPIGWGNSVQPSLAIRDDGDVPDVRVVLRQKVEPDCDGDGVTADDGDLDDREAMDLQSFTYDAEHGLGPAVDVAVNDRTCIDRGVSVVGFDAGVAHTCFTEKVSGIAERVACAEESSGGWSPEGGPTNHGSGDEDHPTLIVAGGERIVATHKVNVGAPDAVRVHLVDRVPPPHEPIVDFLSNGGMDGAEDAVQYPALDAGGDTVELVYQDGTGRNAHIWYSECDDGLTGCSDAGDWTAPEVVADASTGLADWAGHAQIATDGDRQWVAYVHDADPNAGVQARVVAATRCRGDDWRLAEVRAPENAAFDQSLEFGRPSLTVDTDDHVAHLVFAEFDDYVRRDDLATRTHEGSLLWCTRAYDPCSSTGG